MKPKDHEIGHMFWVSCIGSKGFKYIGPARFIRFEPKDIMMFEKPEEPFYRFNFPKPYSCEKWLISSEIEYKI